MDVIEVLVSRASLLYSSCISGSWCVQWTWHACWTWTHKTSNSLHVEARMEKRESERAFWPPFMERPRGGLSSPAIASYGPWLNPVMYHMVFVAQTPTDRVIVKSALLLLGLTFSSTSCWLTTLATATKQPPRNMLSGDKPSALVHTWHHFQGGNQSVTPLQFQTVAGTQLLW